MTDVQNTREGFHSDELLWVDKNDSSYIDLASGSFNRNAFEDLGRRQFAELKREGLPLTAIFLDINKFKEVNDEYGHAEGDQRLNTLVRKLLDSIRQQDYIFRYGGDEFILFMHNIGKEKVEELIIPKVRNSLRESKLEAGIGIDQAKSDENFEDFVNRVDKLMYIDKKGRKND
jgi:diguanylate cyclase (GGDEF)-like protein